MLEHLWFCSDCTAKQWKYFLLSTVQVEVLFCMVSSGYLDCFLNCSLNRKGLETSLNNYLLVFGEDQGEGKSFKHICDFLEMPLCIRDV